MGEEADCCGSRDWDAEVVGMSDGFDNDITALFVRSPVNCDGRLLRRVG